MRSFSMNFELVSRFVLLSAFVFCAWPPTFVFAEQGNEKPLTITPLKVGVIVPLTGGVAVWGESVQSAMVLANEESQQPAKLLFQDEQTCSPSKAISAFHFLHNVEKVDVLIASCLEGAQAVAPLAKQAKIPFFIAGRSSEEFQTKFPNALSWLSLLDYEGLAIAELAREKGWKKGTAIVWSGYFGVQFAEGIRRGLEKTNVPFDFETIEIEQDSMPTGSHTLRLLRNEPDVIFLMMSEPAAASVVKQLKSRQFPGTIIVQSSMLQTYDPAARAIFAGALQQKFPGDEFEFKKLQQRVKERQGKDAADDFIFSYDGFKALLPAATHCKSDPLTSLNDCLTRELRNEQWREGVSGRFRFMKSGATERPMIFRTISRDGFE